MKEVLKNVVSYFILHEKINDCRNTKNDHIRNQEYSKAADARDLEMNLLKQLPKLKEFEEWMDILNKED